MSIARSALSHAAAALIFAAVATSASASAWSGDAASAAAQHAETADARLFWRVGGRVSNGWRGRSRWRRRGWRRPTWRFRPSRRRNIHRRYYNGAHKKCLKRRYGRCVYWGYY